jgi:L-fuculose-phosphate aldolase
MVKDERELRHEIVRIGQLMYQKGWVAANDGNISVRLDAGRVLCTPTGISKGMMEPEDLIVCNMQCEKLEGQRERTSELLMHVTIYEQRPDVMAVVHAHPPVSTGFATAGRALDKALLPEVVIGLGSVPLASYGLPGTPALTEPMMPYIPNYDAILLANHGVVCYGADLWNAYFKMETVEHHARITLGPNVLPRVEVDKLIASRGRYGVKLRQNGDCGRPLAAEDLEES